MPAGRPTDYNPSFCDEARALCEGGATDVELADHFGVEIRSIKRWKNKHEEFRAALKLGKEAADDRVVDSLYHRAVGYTFEAVKIFNANGAPLVVPYREHVPPDTTAAIFWLKNRRPEEFRDKSVQEITGKDGGAVEFADVSDRERAKALLALMAKSGGGPSGDDVE